MAFTNEWDNTFPPDTQAANQLGADIRNMKIDVQQRMAAISGPDAGKQNYEAGFAGVMYFATDTGKVYYWSGAVWTEITSTLLKTVLDLKAPLASPALTGTPTAPTAVDGTETTQIATTAFVKSAATTNKLTPSGSLAGSGYIYLGTLLLQWVTGASSAAQQTVNFPIAFPTACFAVFVQCYWGATGDLSTSGFSVCSFNAAGVVVMPNRRTDDVATAETPIVFAIGH